MEPAATKLESVQKLNIKQTIDNIAPTAKWNGRIVTIGTETVSLPGKQVTWRNFFSYLMDLVKSLFVSEATIRNAAKELKKEVSHIEKQFYQEVATFEHNFMQAHHLKPQEIEQFKVQMKQYNQEIESLAVLNSVLGDVELGAKSRDDNKEITQTLAPILKKTHQFVMQSTLLNPAVSKVKESAPLAAIPEENEEDIDAIDDQEALKELEDLEEEDKLTASFFERLEMEESEPAPLNDYEKMMDALDTSMEEAPDYDNFSKEELFTDGVKQHEAMLHEVFTAVEPSLNEEQRQYFIETLAKWKRDAPRMEAMIAKGITEKFHQKAITVMKEEFSRIVDIGKQLENVRTAGKIERHMEGVNQALQTLSESERSRLTPLIAPWKTIQTTLMEQAKKEPITSTPQTLEKISQMMLVQTELLKQLQELHRYQSLIPSSEMPEDHFKPEIASIMEALLATIDNPTKIEEIAKQAEANKATYRSTLFEPISTQILSDMRKFIYRNVGKEAELESPHEEFGIASEDMSEILVLLTRIKKDIEEAPHGTTAEKEKQFFMLARAFYHILKTIPELPEEEVPAEVAETSTEATSTEQPPGGLFDVVFDKVYDFFSSPEKPLETVKEEEGVPEAQKEPGSTPPAISVSQLLHNLKELLPFESRPITFSKQPTSRDAEVPSDLD